MKSKDLGLIVSMFHDVGKMIINVQNKILGKMYEGYSNHSYASTYYLINAFVNNREVIIKRFSNIINENNYRVILIILSNIILGHHGHLRSINNLINHNEWDKMIESLKNDNIIEKLNMFFSKHDNVLGIKLTFIDDIENHEFYKKLLYIDNEEIKKYQDNALNYYFETLTLYSDLIYSDRKDASNNTIDIRTKNRIKYCYSLENNLDRFIDNFESNSELNIARTNIRNLAVKNLRDSLQSKDVARVFTLNAPTGSGKTVMLLSLANEINSNNNYEYDIIYSLPFQSIIDQVSKIINNKLLVNTLDYTSVSDTTRDLEKIIETGNNNDILKYLFSENNFDHPFIITTLNQIFESLINNKASKLIKLTNLRKRIILIDEYQATNPANYYVLFEILNKFCEKYDSYAIISTATMPRLNLDLSLSKHNNLSKIFKNNLKHIELLSKSIFDNNVFNRYNINFIGKMNNVSLYERIRRENKNVLLIMNTIASSREMYETFNNKGHEFEKIHLLHSKITPNKRINIINEITSDLLNKRKILIISTQVIEAGIDISLETVYRSAAPPPNIIQALGRGNRNGEYGIIDTFVFLYTRTGNKHYDCYSVYGNLMSSIFIKDIENKIDSLTEIEFQKKCENYFYSISEYLEQGKFNLNQNIVDLIEWGRFDELGKYSFIEDDMNKITIYVGDDNDLWEEYLLIVDKINKTNNFNEKNIHGIELKKIRNHIIKNSINVSDDEIKKKYLSNPVYGIYKLLDSTQYDFTIGFTF